MCCSLISYKLLILCGEHFPWWIDALFYSFFFFFSFLNLNDHVQITHKYTQCTLFTVVDPHIDLIFARLVCTVHLKCFFLWQLINYTINIHISTYWINKSTAVHCKLLLKIFGFFGVFLTLYRRDGMVISHYSFFVEKNPGLSTRYSFDCLSLKSKKKSDDMLVKEKKYTNKNTTFFSVTDKSETVRYFPAFLSTRWQHSNIPHLLCTIKIKQSDVTYSNI